VNTKELLEQIQTTLRAAAWPTSAEPVFASESVIVTIVAPEAVYENYRCPQVHISPGGMQADGDSHPRLISQEVVVRLVVIHASDGTGEAALLGAHRTANTSRNAGLLQVETELMDSLAKMQNDESVSIILRSSSAGKASPLPDGRYVAVRDYNFSARITTLL